MKILVSNDDGIYADGIKALVNEMKKLGEVVVSAPATHQSGAGHSITFNQIVKVEKIDFDSDVVGYKVFGKPKDCVELALSVLTSDIDLVITGIFILGFISYIMYYLIEKVELKYNFKR